jgi:hypothetical protein
MNPTSPEMLFAYELTNERVGDCKGLGGLSTGDSEFNFPRGRGGCPFYFDEDNSLLD